jgi:hypothetical protein
LDLISLLVDEKVSLDGNVNTDSEDYLWQSTMTNTTKEWAIYIQS